MTSQEYSTNMLILWQIIIRLIYRYTFLKFFEIFNEFTILCPREYKNKAINPSMKAFTEVVEH